MAQYYSLEEAARVLGISPEELNNMARTKQIHAYSDGGTWQFRTDHIDEQARKRGLGSDPDLSLSDLDLEVPDGSSSGEFDLSEFQLGTNDPDLGARTGSVATSRHADEDEQDIQFDDLTLPAGPLSNSSSTIIGMKQGGKQPGDSDVRLVPDKPSKDASDSDVRLMPLEARRPSDSDVTLVNDEEGSMPDLDALGKSPGERGPGRLGSSDEVEAARLHDSGSDFELMPADDGLTAALTPESGSDFELTAYDASDEFEATPLAGPSDSDVTAAQPSASGINLSKPSDSGINLQGIGAFDLSDDSIELAPMDDDDSMPTKPAPKPKAVPPPPSNKVQPVDPGATSLGMTEKDIFEDTDFSLEVNEFDADRDDRTVQLERSSDFDLEDSDSASEVFALDEDDVDQNAATAMGAALAADDDDDSGDFAATSSGGGASGWDVENEVSPSPSAASTMGSRLAPVGPQAEWGGIWVGLLGFTSVLVLTGMVFSFDLIRNLYGFQNDGPAAGLIKQIAGLFG